MGMNKTTKSNNQGIRALPWLPLMTRTDRQVGYDPKTLSSGSHDRKESQKSKMEPAGTGAEAGVKRALKRLW